MQQQIGHIAHLM